MVSDSPPERDMEWSNSGVEGSYKFLNKLLRMVDEVRHLEEIIDVNSLSLNNYPALIKIHRSIQDVKIGRAHV